MTKYILNSGGLRNAPELAKKFFAEAVKGLGPHPRILICYFAQPRENWAQKFEKDEKMDYFPKNVHPIFELAFPDKFEEQIKKSDIIYMYGGDDHLIQCWLKRFNIPRIWEGKVVVTNSSSSHALVKHFWTCDWRELMDGLGILPIKFIAHFDSSYGNDDPRGPINWNEARKSLETYGDPSLPLHALKEGEHITIEI